MSKNFDELHTESYKKILKNKGFLIEETIKSLELTYNLSKIKVTSLKDDFHPFLKKI
jgi:UDP-N-acetyl-2-amino-2-deoxyglucuronate dehydrogenase